MSTKKRHSSLSVQDPQLPTEVSATLMRLMQLGFNQAGTPYVVETRVLEANQLSFSDLRSVLRARRAARVSRSGARSSKKTPILRAAGRDKTHTMFWLHVHLTR